MNRLKALMKLKAYKAKMASSETNSVDGSTVSNLHKQVHHKKHNGKDRFQNQLIASYGLLQGQYRSSGLVMLCTFLL